MGSESPKYSATVIKCLGLVLDWLIIEYLGSIPAHLACFSLLEFEMVEKRLGT